MMIIIIQLNKALPQVLRKISHLPLSLKQTTIIAKFLVIAQSHLKSHH